MNILFVSCNFRLFDKLDCGAATRSTMFIEALSQIAHVDVISFYKDIVTSNIENCDVIGCYPPNINNYKSTKRPVLTKLSTHLKLLLFPLSTNTYYRPNTKFERIVDEQLKLKKYDFIACRYIFEAVNCGLIKYSDKLIIDVDDNPVSASFRDLANAQFKCFLTKGLAYYRAYTLGLTCKLLLKKIMISFHSNTNEPPSRFSCYLPNVTSIDTDIDDITENTPMNILFVGWLDFFPNKKGILHFVNNVFPLVKKKIPNVKLHIAGKSSNQNLLSELNSIDGVKALGFVDDIIEEYKNSRIIIVPIYQGSGTSVKFIEGTKMNRPIITTYYGVRGFDNLFRENIDYLLATDDDDFAKKIVYLLNSKEKSMFLSHNAHSVWKQNFSKEKFFDIVKSEVLKKYEDK